MDNKHTPGPWTPVERDYSIGIHPADANTGAIGEVYMHSGQYGWSISRAECEANAKLIAAAPDLLAALGRIELRLTQARIASGIGQPRLKDADFLRRECERIATDAREAIANATK